jgi:hypothetical protein
MDQEKRESPRDDRPFAIDYDHIDVARIMDQIKKEVADEAQDDRAQTPKTSSPLPGFDPGSAPGSSEARGKIRRILLKIMSPLKPVIKLLILPVYEEQRQTVQILDHTNGRLDRLYRIVQSEQGGVIDRQREYIKLLHHLCHNLVVELSKLKIELETLKTKTRILEKDFESLGKREKALEKEVQK